MKTVKIALLGFGTVSQGTFNLLQDNVDLITNRSGVTIEISKYLFAAQINTQILHYQALHNT